MSTRIYETCVFELDGFRSEGQQLRYCGLGHSYDDIFIDGNPGELNVYDVQALCENVTNRFAVCCLLLQGRQGRCCRQVSLSCI